MLDRHFIGGRWQTSQGRERLTVSNPFLGAEMTSVAGGDARDVDVAAAAAKAAFPGWRDLGGAGRAKYLRAIAAEFRRLSEDLARLSSQNNSKPIAEARIDMADAASCYDYYAGKAERLEAGQGRAVAVPDPAYRSILRREPAGPVGLIVPWNFPLVTSAWKLAPGLAAGCTAVLKPSEITPLPEMELASIAQAVGLPDGVLNIVNGTGLAVGAAMVAHPDLKKISFTGSTVVGTQVMKSAAEQIKSVGLELGGKSPILVFADADFDMALDIILGGIFFNAGQMCSATSRLLIERRIEKRLLEALVARAEALTPGDPLDENTNFGPLTMKGQLAKVAAYVARAEAEGLQRLTGGGGYAAHPGGWFHRPTIFRDVPLTSRLWREEIFGPVLVSRSFETEDEAVALANDSDYGLVATVLTADADRAERLARQIEAGHIWVNAPQAIFVETSWGGFKASSLGRELGPWGLSAYLEVKHVTTRTSGGEQG